MFSLSSLLSVGSFIRHLQSSHYSLSDQINSNLKATPIFFNVFREGGRETIVWVGRFMPAKGARSRPKRRKLTLYLYHLKTSWLLHCKSPFQSLNCRSCAIYCLLPSYVVYQFFHHLVFHQPTLLLFVFLRHSVVSLLRLNIRKPRGQILLPHLRLLFFLRPRV